MNEERETNYLRWLIFKKHSLSHAEFQCYNLHARETIIEQ